MTRDFTHSIKHNRPAAGGGGQHSALIRCGQLLTRCNPAAAPSSAVQCALYCAVQCSEAPRTADVTTGFCTPLCEMRLATWCYYRTRIAHEFYRPIHQHHRLLIISKRKKQRFQHNSGKRATTNLWFVSTLTTFTDPKQRFGMLFETVNFSVKIKKKLFSSLLENVIKLL